MEIRKKVLILLISSITLYIKEIDVFVKFPNKIFIKKKERGGGRLSDPSAPFPTPLCT